MTIGTRVEWDNGRRGTVHAVLDNNSLAVEWDDPKLGCTSAPMWRLRRVIECWEEPTCPYALWDGKTLADEIVEIVSVIEVV